MALLVLWFLALCLDAEAHLYNVVDYQAIGDGNSDDTDRPRLKQELRRSRQDLVMLYEVVVIFLESKHYMGHPALGLARLLELPHSQMPPLLIHNLEPHSILIDKDYSLLVFGFALACGGILGKRLLSHLEHSIFFRPYVESHNAHGVFFFRRSRWSEEFLDTWCNQTSFVCFESTMSGDNTAMKHLIHGLPPKELQVHVHTSPMQCLFNSYPWLPTVKNAIRLISSPIKTWKGAYSNGDFMVHLAGLDEKKKWADKILIGLRPNK